MTWLAAAPSVLASFMASAVECVEALTIVLAVGVVRGWRPALLGAVAGMAVLAGLVLALGPSLAAVPLPVLQVVVGTLLSMFGLRWLQKAVLRAAGIVALRDEAAAYASTSEALGAGAIAQRRFDGVAFLASFKAVVLEGVEVVFIVVAIGAHGRLLVPASLGATLALLVVIGLGVALHRPLARVPENTLKFAVGVMLSAFGTFWVGEGIGLRWPGGDAAIPVLMAVMLAIALALVVVCRRERQMRVRSPGATATHAIAKRPRMWRRVGSEVAGLFVDDGWLAIGILAWTIGAWIPVAHEANTTAACLLFAIGGPLLLATTAWRRARD